MSKLNGSVNLLNEQEELLAGIFNSDMLDRKYSGQLTFGLKPGTELDLSDWEVLKSDVTLSSGKKGEAPDGSDHYTVSILTRVNAKSDQVDVMYVTTAGESAAPSDPDDFRRSDFVTLKLASDDESSIQPTIATLVEGKIHVPVIVPENPNMVNIGYWSWGQMGAARRRRKMMATPWEEVAVNYSSTVRNALSDLGTISPENLPGKMVLLHGPPGTGKTSFLRSLALEWKSWCDLEVVLDPEVLFNNSDYLIQLLSERRESERWTMLLLEDCDELIRKEAKAISGQSLSRLLNSTDGFIGYGHNLIVGITTNEPLETLNEAVMRNGRCLAKVQVPPLTQSEAIAWLDDPEVATAVKGDTTLADLFALKHQTKVITEEKPEEKTESGLYL